ncbi:MAG TPA: hypothetical protein VFF06_24915 [Polyangia bacterium]|nr:hypothetical protein [Polyangia bacterium]
MRRSSSLAVVCLLMCVPAGCNTNGNNAQDDGGADLRSNVEDAGGPCVVDTDCPSTSTEFFVCAYKIADGCSAHGRCAPIHVPTCASFIELCGCDGSKVRSGSCMYQDGYAGGPTTGSPGPTCGDGGP